MLLWINTSGTFFVAASVYFFASREGMIGAAIGWAVGYFLQFQASAFITCVALSIPYRKFLSALLPPLLCAGAMFTLLEFFRFSLFADFSPGIRIAGFIAIGGFTYPALLFILRRQLFIDAYASVRGFLEPRGNGADI